MNSGRCSKYFLLRCDLKVSRSQAKIDENFANYFLKTKANNKCCIRLQKRISELERQNLSPRRCDNSKFTLTLKLMRLFIGRLNLCDGCILYVVFHIHVNTHVQCACMSIHMCSVHACQYTCAVCMYANTHVQCACMPIHMCNVHACQWFKGNQI